MTQEAEQIIATALTLPPEARANVADRILSSLDRPDDDIDIAWRREIEDRIAAYHSGRLKKVPLRDVLARYRK